MDHNQDIVAGLDIGTTKIACIVGRKNEQGKIEILGMGKAKSDGVSRGVVSQHPEDGGEHRGGRARWPRIAPVWTSAP
jgi:cell division ATPase FtsA